MSLSTQCLLKSEKNNKLNDFILLQSTKPSVTNKMAHTG